MKQLKPCKGINKASGYSGCGELVPAQSRQYGLCLPCLREWAHSTGEGQEYIRKRLIPQAKKEVEKKEKEKKEKLTIDTTNWKNKLQTEVQKIARFIDHGLLCLARNQPGQMHGGHVYAKGGHSNMRFNLHNIHRQTAQSNKWNSDDGLLREKLAEEYGPEYLEMLKSLRNSEQVKWSNIQYHAFYLKARKIANRLKKENEDLIEPRSVQERITLRESINQELGIYKYYYPV